MARIDSVSLLHRIVGSVMHHWDEYVKQVFKPGEK
jgi:hypothetical protein